MLHAANLIRTWVCCPMLVAASLAAVTAPALAQPSGGAFSMPPTTQPAATQPVDPRTLPHIKIDREHRTVDLEAHVCLREAKWLEMLACTRDTHDYESVLTVDARPSHIHLALLLLGLEPGAPMTYKREGDKIQVTPPHGPRVGVTLLFQKDGKQVEVKPSEWIINQKTNQPLPENVWLFSGSKMFDQGGRKLYLADLNGSAITIVNFGDDLLVRPGTMTNQDDDATWGANTKAIPPIGTPVTIRLTPLEK